MGIDVTKILGFRKEIMIVNIKYGTTWGSGVPSYFHLICGVILPWLTLGKRIGDQWIDEELENFGFGGKLRTVTCCNMADVRPDVGQRSLAVNLELIHTSCRRWCLETSRLSKWYFMFCISMGNPYSARDSWYVSYVFLLKAVFMSDKHRSFRATLTFFKSKWCEVCGIFPGP